MVVVAVVAAYFNYIPMRGKLRPVRKDPATVQADVLNRPYDAFLYRVPEDSALAEQIARHLRGRGLRVFLAPWIDLGAVQTAAKEAATLATRSTLAARSGWAPGRADRGQWRRSWRSRRLVTMRRVAPR
ncbi:hypothetical protein FHR83_008331 [Actinoplanes campanulatus]|uniref:Uncharacterized protein n=1 Tax=Actinoplanes campanulatus TaxID=113559 RepID=A0A7W5AQH8_9ACTN|nr:hypothetical protein [Actinoplanes campanulatus]MBB3100606.1 hypothetical protein [Actinoplanes campanulatus]GGN45893.1 hypothetical protein GCM10010109_80560 [Actinoplanes campanulatus]GID41065.1 hypothetical protein Aca09nite_75710 [Actinoplanes campanulatus]